MNAENTFHLIRETVDFVRELDGAEDFQLDNLIALNHAASFTHLGNTL